MASAQSKRTYTSCWDVCPSLPARFYDMNTTFRSAATIPQARKEGFNGVGSMKPDIYFTMGWVSFAASSIL